MCRERETKQEMESDGIYFKEWAHTIIEVQVQNLQDRLAGSRPKKQLCYNLNPKAIWRQNSFFLEEVSLFSIQALQLTG